MPPLPWTTSTEVARDTPCTVLATRLPLRSYRAVPAFLRWTMRIRRQLAVSPGLVGYALNAELLSKTFWTVSAWTSADDMARFAAAAPHREAVAAMRPFMGRPSFVRWRCTAGELPIAWAEVRRRADDASARHGHGVTGDAVPITPAQPAAHGLAHSDAGEQRTAGPRGGGVERR